MNNAKHALQDQKILALIPARSGSVGIPRKNVADLGGKPLISYSIEAALATPLISRVIVSTDDEDIARVARSLGAETPFLRPASLAGDRSPLGEAITHCRAEMEKREGSCPEIFVLLYPTQPFRRPGLLNHLCAKLLEGHNEVITAKRIAAPFRNFFRFANTGVSLPLGSQNGAPCPDYLFPSGYFSGFHLDGDIPPNPYIHIIDDPIMLHDIDDLCDLDAARKIIAHGLFDPALVARYTGDVSA